MRQRISGVYNFLNLRRRRCLKAVKLRNPQANGYDIAEVPKKCSQMTSIACSYHIKNPDSSLLAFFYSLIMHPKLLNPAQASSILQ